MTQSLSVPVLDISQVSGAELVAGLQARSCVLLTGLGALPAQAQAVVDTSAAFFARDEADKAKVQWSGEGEWAGWQPLYAATGAGALALERFEVALPNPDGFDSTAEWTARFGQWPAEPAELPTIWAAYYRSMRALTDQIVRLLADELDVPVADVEAWTTRQHSNLCVNHYLAQLEPPGSLVRQNPHKDLGGLTLLWTDGQPGLEAQIGPDGAWVPLAPPPDMLLLQAGDLLHLFSGGTIPANNHRVVNPPRGPGITQTARYSLVYFHHPDLDTWIAPDPDAGGVHARSHVLERQRAAYAAS